MNQQKIKLGNVGEIKYQIRVPEGEPSVAVILLHGLGGTEHSMWVLESALPENALLISPRGLFEVSSDSFSWVDTRLNGWPRVEDFSSSVQGLKWIVSELKDNQFNLRNLIVMGFSQGASLAFAAASSLAPTALIVAAGFLPRGDLNGLQDVPVFWGHGKFDEWVPISRAREDVKSLITLGANVDYCEADVGHKLGLECLQGLRKWLTFHLSEKKRN